MIEFSVSVCTYDGDSEEHLNQALNSVLNQSAMPSQLVIVVDGPVRESLNTVIEKFDEAHECAKLVRLERNLGHGNARRVGLSHCSHEIVALMDADDVSLPDRFEKQLARFQKNPNLSLVGGAIEEFVVIDGDEVPCSVRELPERDEEIKSMLRWRCPINQPTVMFRRSAVLAAGGYLDWYCNEDYYLWIRMALNGAVFENVPEVIVKFRIDDSTYERRGGLRYFFSESKLQFYIYRRGLSNVVILVWNVSVRFIAQVLCPPNVRKFLHNRVFRRRLEIGGQPR